MEWLPTQLLARQRPPFTCPRRIFILNFPSSIDEISLSFSFCIEYFFLLWTTQKGIVQRQLGISSTPLRSRFDRFFATYTQIRAFGDEITISW
jgi:hypothetical protein